MKRFEPWQWIIGTTAYNDDPAIRDLRLDEIKTFLLNEKTNSACCVAVLDGSGRFLIPPASSEINSSNLQDALVTLLPEMKTENAPEA